MPEIDDEAFGKGEVEKQVDPFRNLNIQQKKVYVSQKLLVQAIERVPGLTENLCGPARGRTIGKEEILTALRNAREGPYQALIDGGMATQEVEQLHEILELLYPRTMLDEGWCSILRDRVKVFSFSFMFAGCVTLALGVHAFVTTPWREGRCWITGYDGHCTACKFQIRVQDVGTMQLYLKRHYTPARRRTWETEDVVFVDEPFFCCGRSNPNNPSEPLNCCDGFFDRQNDAYCDQWSHLSKQGMACPTGDWPCEFKPPNGSTRQTFEIYELRIGIDRSGFYMIISGAGLFGLGLIRLLVRPVWERLRKVPGKLREVFQSLKEAFEARREARRKAFEDLKTWSPKIKGKTSPKSKQNAAKETPEAQDSTEEGTKEATHSKTSSPTSSQIIEEEEADENLRPAKAPARAQVSELRPIITPLSPERKRRQWAQMNSARRMNSSDELNLSAGAQTFHGESSGQWARSTWSDSRSMQRRQDPQDHWDTAKGSDWKDNVPMANTYFRRQKRHEEIDEAALEESLKASFAKYRLKTPGPALGSSQLGYRSWTRWSPERAEANRLKGSEMQRMSRSCESFRTRSSDRSSERQSDQQVVVSVAAPSTSSTHSPTRSPMRRNAGSEQVLRNAADPMRRTIQ